LLLQAAAAGCRLLQVAAAGCRLLLCGLLQVAAAGCRLLLCGLLQVTAADYCCCRLLLQTAAAGCRLLQVAATGCRLLLCGLLQAAAVQAAAGCRLLLPFDFLRFCFKTNGFLTFLGNHKISWIPPIFIFICTSRLQRIYKGFLQIPGCTLIFIFICTISVHAL